MQESLKPMLSRDMKNCNTALVLKKNISDIHILLRDDQGKAIRFVKSYCHFTFSKTETESTIKEKYAVKHHYLQHFLYRKDAC